MELSGLPGPILIQKWRTHPIKKRRNTPVVVTTDSKISSLQEAILEELDGPRAVQKPVSLPKLTQSLSTVLKWGSGSGHNF